MHNVSHETRRLLRATLNLANRNSTFRTLLRSEFVRQVRANADIVVSDVDFVSGQEPSDDGDDDFAADLSATVTIRGATLARLLGAQARTLERKLAVMRPDQAIRALDNASPKKVLQAIKRHAQRVVGYYAHDTFGHGAVLKDVSFTEDRQYWSADIDPRSGQITFSIEVSSYGEWKR